MENNEFGMEDMLKKAFGADNDNAGEKAKEKPEKDIPDLPRFGSIVEIMRNGALIRLAKAAQEKERELIIELRDELSTIDIDDSYSVAKFTVRIQQMAKKLDVIDNVKSLSACSGMESLKPGETNYKKVFEKFLSLFRIES